MGLFYINVDKSQPGECQMITLDAGQPGDLSDNSGERRVGVSKP